MATDAYWRGQFVELIHQHATLRHQFDKFLEKQIHPPLILTDDARAQVQKKQDELDRFKKLIGPFYIKKKKS